MDTRFEMHKKTLNSLPSQGGIHWCPLRKGGNLSFNGGHRDPSAWTPLTSALLMLLILAGVGRAEVLQPDRINPKGHAGDVLAVAFSPDGKTVVTAGSDRLAKVWDVATGSVRADLAGHEGKVLCVAVSADGKTVATGSEDRTVRLWSMVDGARLGILSGHSGEVDALASGPTGRFSPRAALIPRSASGTSPRGGR
jgi:WD40 repeat protein